MAQITVNISMSKTSSTLDASAIAAILTWVDTNIKQKLPSDCSLSINLTIIP